MFAYAVQLIHWESTPPGQVGKSHEQGCRHTWEGRFVVIAPNLPEAVNLVKHLPVRSVTWLGPANYIKIEFTTFKSSPPKESN